MTAIIILNWNGSEDTIECIQSLRRVKEDYFCIVADNGSDDDSVISIQECLKKEEVCYRVVKEKEYLYEKPSLHEFILYTLSENLGFAKGNNEAIRLVSFSQPDHYLLLNNDTIVEPDFLKKIEDFSNANLAYKALTPLICYNHNRNIIWNCGGKQCMGFRKYYYAKQNIHNIKETGHINVTFLTGCALFFHPDLLQENGGIFTEDFFFGEEDFNFCMRMNQAKQKMACVLGSKIYHKVSSSTKSASIGKYYIHYLNRFIDIRKNTSCLFYRLWTIPSTIYTILLLKKVGLGFPRSIKFMQQVFSNAEKKEKVTQSDFKTAIEHEETIS